MKKYRWIFVLLFSISIIGAFVACGGPETPPAGEKPTQPNPDAGSTQPETSTGDSTTPKESQGSSDVLPEGKVCQAGAEQPCFTGDAKKADVGICQKGTQKCLSEGVWGNCENEVLPGTETCNGKDDDCNGKVDDELAELKKPCSIKGEKGPCADGKASCKGGKLSCDQVTFSKTEECNGKDDDCDGEIDEEVAKDCDSSGKGECKKGKQVCKDGKFEACAPIAKPGTETCNNKDDDCDGSVDEELSKPCGLKDEGECKKGKQMCENGRFGACTGQIGPKNEECNGKDDDCDGKTDEELTKACGTDVGECTKGTQVCKNGKFEACTGEKKPGKETCNNKDDDCDGTVDEGITRPCGAGSGKGECKGGTQTCKAGQFGICAGQVKPKPETCNNKDDDCDGTVDEGLTKACGTDTGACKKGKSTCKAGKYGACVGEIKPKAETCNNIDDDCDGTVDEGMKKHTYYQDKDGDGAGNPKVKITACTQPKGYVVGSTDCYDNNKNARPGQTGYFSVHRGDGKFDYNCDGKETGKERTGGRCNGCSPVLGFTTNVRCGAKGSYVTGCARVIFNICRTSTQNRVQTCR